MKITIYELLGLIKDGKAPLKIKYKNYCYKWTGDDYKTMKHGVETFLITGEEYDYVTEFLNDEIEVLEEVEDKEYEDIDIINGDYVVPNTPATENEAYIMACFLAHEQMLNALIRNQKYILERLDKND